MFADIRQALKHLLSQPGFAIAAVTMLALGIGANTAIFSVVNAVLLRPLRYYESDRLVMLWGNFLKLNMQRLPAKLAEYRDYSEQTALFADTAAFANQSFTLTGTDRPERISAARVTANLFPLLRVQPLEGRGFAAEEDEADQGNVVVLNYAFWQRRFGGDRRVLGHQITLDDQTYTIVGVMPPEFQFPHPGLPSSEPAELWMPLTYTAEQIAQRRGPYYLNVLARLKPGVTLDRARAGMYALAYRFEQEKRGYRGPNGEDGGWRITVVPLQEEIVGASRRALFVLLGAVGLLLLIACANVANLQLLKASKRRKELAIRSALGASRWRLMRLLTMESLTLAGLGGACGFVLAQWGIQLLGSLSSVLPRAQEVSIDRRVLTVTIAVTIFTGFLVGFVPSLIASRLDLQTVLKGGEINSAKRLPRQYWNDGLVSGEIALSLLLLIGAGLLVNSLVRLQRVKTGIKADHLITAAVNLSAARYRDPEQASIFFLDLIQRIESLPGVETASLSTIRPLRGMARNDPFAIEGRPLDPNSLTTAGWQMVGANYFRTLGINIIRGRDLTLTDFDHSAPVVAVINERMARRYWPNEDPIGHRICLGLPRPDNPWVTIVGIARDTPHRGVDSNPEPDWYLSRALGPQLTRYLLVRTAGNPALLENSIAATVAALDRDQPLTNVRTMNDVVSETIAPRKLNTWLLGGFAGLAFGLSTLGIFSVISYSVALRSHEIGIRMALGARNANVLALVVKQGMTLALIGTLIGIGGAFVLTKLMSSLLFEVSASDPLTYSLITLCSLSVAFIASYIPARRALNVDPIATLKSV